MNKINFENLPSTNTPLNAENLNLLQTNVEDVFNGMNTAGNMVVDSIKTKNLFRGFLSGAYNSSTGVFDTTTSGISTPKTEVESGAKYYLSGMQSGITIRVLFWNNGAFVSSTTMTPTSDGVVITMAGNQFAFQTATTNQYSNVMLEKGEEKTDYKPFENLKGEDLYSGVETKIGTWIDGKPLYRKIFNLSSITTSNTDLIDISSLNIQTKVKLYGMLNTSSANSFPIPMTDSSSNYSVIFTTSTAIRGRAAIGSGNFQSGWIAIEYTKTTD